MRFLSGIFILILGSPAFCVANQFEIKPTDRIVLIGSTMIEREQRYGYWETMLTQKFPGIKVRNLAWSGDNVLGEARRAFEVNQTEIGRSRLIELAIAEKPTVIIICYGAVESFESEKGLASFTKEYTKLIQLLRPTNARIALMSPPPLEKMPSPLPDPKEQNRRLALYRDAIASIAKSQNLYFADLFAQLGGEKGLEKGLTDNGMHFTEKGYELTSSAFMESLGYKVQSDFSNFEALENVRKAVVNKNELYFHRWRPQNQTYLLGFRKHEQGQNAKEIVQFDPLVSNVEKEIEKLLKK